MSTARFMAEKVLVAAQAAHAAVGPGGGLEGIEKRAATRRLVSLATAASTEFGDKYVMLSSEDLLLIYEQMVTK